MALRLAFPPSVTVSGKAASSPAFSYSVGLKSHCPAWEFKCSRSDALALSFHQPGATCRKSRNASLVAKAVEQAADTSVGGVTEVTQETFWPIVEAAGDKLVVLDMYTQWCGPCKIMYPKIVELSGKYTDVTFLKLDCNQENKALAKELGVRVVPTFKIFKNREEVAEVKGAKFDELVHSIENLRAS